MKKRQKSSAVTAFLTLLKVGNNWPLGNTLVSFPGGSMVKNPPAVQELQETMLDPWVRKVPWKREWQPTPVFFPGEFHGQRSLMGYIVHGVTKGQT